VHESRRRWGTLESPCPILGLVPGGECWGLVFEVPDAERRLVEGALDKREAAGERRRESGTTEASEGPVDAWVWVSRPSDGDGGADLEAVEARLRAAHGVVGTGAEYVRTLVHAMEPHGIQDPLVEALWKRLQR